MTTTATDAHTTGRLEREHGIPAWLLRKLEERGAIPRARRLGQVRWWPAEELPLLVSAAAEYGYGPEA